MLKPFLAFLTVCTIGAGIFFVIAKNDEVEKIAMLNSEKGSLEQLKELLTKQDSQPGSDQTGKPTSQDNKPQTEAYSDSESVENQFEKILTSANTEVKVPSDEPVSLWEQDNVSQQLNSETDDTIEHEERIKADTEALTKLQVGQVLEFFVPQLGETFQSEIESTSNQLGDVKVWKGKINGENQEDGNFIITQGKIMTNVILATNEGIYNVHINNENGESTIIDDREYSGRISDTDDSIPYPHESTEK